MLKNKLLTEISHSTQTPEHLKNLFLSVVPMDLVQFYVLKEQFA